MNNTTRVGVAVVGGYLLGRFKKARLAVALGSAMMGKRLNLDVKQLAREGLSQIASSPEVAKLTGQVRQELVNAGRTAAMTAVTGKVEKLADSLQSRTSALQEMVESKAGRPPAGQAREGAGAGQEQGEQPQQAEGGARGEQRGEPRQAAPEKKPSPRKVRPTGGTAARQAAASRARPAPGQRRRTVQESSGAGTPVRRVRQSIKEPGETPRRRAQAAGQSGERTPSGKPGQRRSASD